MSEYDSQLRMVIEWRDPKTKILRQYRMDNVVADVMVEGQEAGDFLKVNPRLCRGTTKV
ncbi:MAG: hypothetical protein Q7U88_08170 [Desulfocapsaceae bacterium]|nr:hypothetical protein [Desulfocapsaceae bacterium]